jgi:hypothetical protein
LGISKNLDLAVRDNEKALFTITNSIFSILGSFEIRTLEVPFLYFVDTVYY